jgi:hypothetical protein
LAACRNEAKGAGEAGGEDSGRLLGLAKAR